MIPKEADGEHFDDALANVVALVVGCLLQMDNDSDLEVIANIITLNLCCPISDCLFQCIIILPCVFFLSFYLIGV